MRPVVNFATGHQCKFEKNNTSDHKSKRGI